MLNLPLSPGAVNVTSDPLSLGLGVGITRKKESAFRMPFFSFLMTGIESDRDMLLTCFVFKKCEHGVI